MKVSCLIRVIQVNFPDPLAALSPLILTLIVSQRAIANMRLVSVSIPDNHRLNKLSDLRVKHGFVYLASHQQLLLL